MPSRAVTEPSRGSRAGCGAPSVAVQVVKELNRDGRNTTTSARLGTQKKSRPGASDLSVISGRKLPAGFHFGKLRFA